MPSSRITSTLRDPFKLTLLIFAVIGFMYFTAEVLKPLSLAVLLSFALAPAVRLLERSGLPRVASVVLAVVLTLLLLGGVGYVVGQQLTSLANQLPSYQGNIERKLTGVMRPQEKSAADRLTDLADRVTAKLEKPAPEKKAGSEEAVDGSTNPAEADSRAIPKVQVVQQPSFQERLRTAIGPYLENLGVGSFVLILVLFILVGREDLSDRIISLFGSRQVSLTTRTIEEIGQRISRYLATFALMNSAYGLVIGLGLAVIGVPYAVLWGCLAAVTRFIPYVGPAVAFVLPLVFSFAYSDGWLQPLAVFGLFAVVETALNSFLEPIIYGKTTGVSALGLLVAAMFWTWLWGTMGLLLSTPLTLCLAVLGKYVPGLRFFATLLAEEADLEPHVRFYQRLVALDREGAVAILDSSLKSMPRVDVFDQLVIPALTLSERDASQDELGEQEQAFVWQVINEFVESLAGIPELGLAALATAVDDGANSEDHAEVSAATTPVSIVGLAATDTSDALVLRMLNLFLPPAEFEMEIITGATSPLHATEQVAAREPKLVLLSHVPPSGLNQTCYLVRKLRAQLPELPIIVGRWGTVGGTSSSAERLGSVGATNVVFTLAEARDRILARLQTSRDTGIVETSSQATGVGTASSV